MRVALFPTCVIDSVGADVGAAVVRVLRRLGYEVTVPRDATCCGQPAWNAGFADEAAKVARTTLDAIADEDLVCVPAGSCATMIRVFWPELFHLTGDEEASERATELASRIKEFSELVDGRASGSHPRKVAYHHSCHMLRELGLKDPPEAALKALDGCELVEWPGAERCCGFGGTFSVKQPEMSVAMADDKADGIDASGADEVVGCDLSCLMQLQGRLRKRGSSLPVRHLAQVLDDAI